MVCNLLIDQSLATPALDGTHIAGQRWEAGPEVLLCCLFFCMPVQGHLPGREEALTIPGQGSEKNERETCFATGMNMQMDSILRQEAGGGQRCLFHLWLTHGGVSQASKIAGELLDSQCQCEAQVSQRLSLRKN